MLRLFSAMQLGTLALTNRLVATPGPSRFSHGGGFLNRSLILEYGRWSSYGIGLIISEPVLVQPSPNLAKPALSADAHIQAFRNLNQCLHEYQSQCLPLLQLASQPEHVLQPTHWPNLREQLLFAAWRAYAAGCPGVVIDANAGSFFHQMRVSKQVPPTSRSQLLLESIEAIRGWLGRRFVVGVRLVVDDLVPDGVSLQESRVLAHELVAAGVDLLDIVVGRSVAPIAQFPGWQIPLVAGIRSIVDVPLIAHGMLGDPWIAEDMLREGCADLVGLEAAISATPHWPIWARQQLERGVEAA
ncbi:hypothetical protein [Herpetosiphon sp. NSE202]|uniref:hypothetical protein n=1 Tax=Herpetosiphon sp. NSE202 TaxID=3351349 RepID=UPI003632D6F4